MAWIGVRIDVGRMCGSPRQSRCFGLKTMSYPKAKWLVLILLVEVWSCLSLTCEKSGKGPDVPLTKVVVDSVEVANLQAEKGEAELLVHGVLPNPAYAIDHIEVKVMGEEIQITPWATHDPQKTVIMVTVPFVEKCKVTRLIRNRVYSVKVEGMNRTAVRQMAVN